VNRLAVVLLAVPALAHADPKPAPKQPDAPEHAVIEVKPKPDHPFKQLAIENTLGDLRVEGYDGDSITVETWKYAPDEDTLDRLHVSLLPAPDGTVHLSTAVDGGREVKPAPRSAMRIDVLIRTPRNMRVDAAVTNGKLLINNMDAGGDLDSSSGDIAVNNMAGELFTHTVSGHTSIVQAFGSVDAATIDSDVSLDTIGGEKLVASANQGRIDGRRVRSRDIELTTTDGRIALEAELALHGHLVISSLHGDIDVRLRSHGAAAIRARGMKVNFGNTPVTHQNDWVTASIGRAISDPMAMVELQSRFANVQFAIVQ
jgi:Putative adhesin